MASPHPEQARGWVQFQRFSELIFLSVGSHWLFAALYGLVYGHWPIAVALGLTGVLVLALYPLSRASLSRAALRVISHLVLLADFAGLHLTLIWTGLPPADSLWWLALWPMFVAHLLGVRDAIAWAVLACAGALFLSANQYTQWIAPLMRGEDNPLLILQLGFVVACASLGVLIRRAYERYEVGLEQQHATIEEQRRILASRNETLEGMLQALQQANLDRTRLFASISHEVRTPLNGLIGFADLLKTTSLTADQARYVRQIEDCSSTVLSITDELLDFTRLEAREEPFSSQPFDALPVVEAAVQMVEPLARSKGVALIRQLPGGELHTEGDPLRLKQVVLNLLGNALKFTERGQVTLRCTSVAAPDGTTRLRVEVEDTGIGIALESQPHLFQPFCRVSAQTIQRFGGSGLGLAISKRLVELMNGNIGVQSQPGRGSLFWFEVPIA